MSWSRLCAAKVQGGMGFKSLRDFNIALLGNQAWRLLSSPDKLVSRVFKVRYYPNGSFLTAKLGSSPSYIWRSVYEAQSLLSPGIGCRVGNGQDIDIINTPWLPTTANPYIHIHSASLENQKVSSLMRVGEIVWDEDLIRDLFEDRDSEIILFIPLPYGVNDSCYPIAILHKNRNDIIWKQHASGSQELVNSALSILNQWKSVQDKSFDSSLGYICPEVGQEQWHLPESNSVKINTDAALFENPSRHSYAFIIRNHYGDFVRAVTKCSVGRVAPEFAEALRIREALSWIKNNQQSNVVLETDCLQVVQMIRSSFSSLSYLGRLIVECRTMMEELSHKNVLLKFYAILCNDLRE
ncbi:uncharacterized protein LOC141680145 [Apium graveolens]|uniref:uncharacterized protein LOC141680145 n=1 Tax=Apium graveolens TaxID=4045 RepID=UPI003D791671